MLEGVITKIYKIGFDLWSVMTSFAVDLFTVDIRYAGTSEMPGAEYGRLYAMCYQIFLYVEAFTLPIAITFFLIALIKDTVSSPPEQQARRFFSDALKYCVIFGILVNLWDVMGYVIQIASGFCEAVADSTTLSISGFTDISADVYTAISDVCNQEPATSVGGLDTMLLWLLEWVGILFEQLALMVAAFITALTCISAGFSVISSAYQRILKPLIILPFSSITVAMAAGGPESERIATSYMKTLFGLLVSGAFMVICISLGNVLSTSDLMSSIASGYTDSSFGKAIFASVQVCITPTVIAGLIKSADSVLGRFF